MNRVLLAVLLLSVAAICGVLIYVMVGLFRKKEGYGQQWDPSGKDATWNPYLSMQGGI